MFTVCVLYLFQCRNVFFCISYYNLASYFGCVLTFFLFPKFELNVIKLTADVH